MRPLRTIAVGVAGAALGAALWSRAKNAPSPRSATPVAYDSAGVRVLILGGGFGGLSVARALARSGRLPADVSVRVVDAAESTTFWPMVPEVISGAVQAAHVVRPLREELAAVGVDFIHANVTGADLGRRTVNTSVGEMAYDKLVIGLGWQTAFFGTPGARDHCMTLESLAEAVAIRNRVIEQFESAAAGSAHGLEFVVVGGGSTGVELVAALADLIDILLPQYPSLRRDDIQLILTQATDDVLPHMEKPLRDAAASRLRDDRIVLRTDARVVAVDARGVALEGGGRIESTNVIWAAGVQANPLAAAITGLDSHDHGRIPVDEFLRVTARPGVYAVGDAAAVHSKSGAVAPTAQAAVQEAAVVAQNVLAEIADRPMTRFQYRELGRLVELGGRFAVSEVMGARVCGWAGQAIWRAVYLYKLGDWRDRLHVGADWLIRALQPPTVPRLRVE